MTNKLLLTLVPLLLLLSITCLAQKQLSADETQNFYRLIKQTKEYKIVKEQTDSVNKAQSTNTTPQEINLDILKKQSEAASDDFIFYASLERRLAIGISLDRYIFQYDKQKKQIISVNHEKSNFRMN